MEAIEIRQYSENDYEQVLLIFQIILEKMEEPILNVSFEEQIKNIRKDYMDNGGQFLVALNGESIIAAGGFYKIKDSIIEIKGMRVSPESQGQGLGGKILNRLESKAISMGYTKAVLDTIAELPANKFYLNHGYLETHRDNVANMEFVFYEKELVSMGA